MTAGNQGEAGGGTGDDYADSDDMLNGMTDPMLSTGAVARRLGVTINTVKAWIRKGSLAAVRLPSGHYRIPSAELGRLLESRVTASLASMHRERVRQWERAEEWSRSRPPENVPIADALSWVAAMLRIARSHGELPEPSVAETVERVRALHRALSHVS